MKTKVVIYGRVSSSNGIQDFSRQVNDLNTLAVKNGWVVEGVFAEKISGAKKNEERAEFMKMIDFVIANDIDKVLITELTRCGRDPLEVLSAIEILHQNRVSLYIQNFGIETLLPNKEVNPTAQMLVTILAEVARMERKTIRERVESGYQNYRAGGGRVGRREGYQKSVEVMKEQYGKEIQLLRKSYSLRNVQAITGTSVNTLRKIKTMI